MKSEEVLQRDAEYRAIREALGVYNVALVLARPPDPASPEACAPKPLVAGVMESGHTPAETPGAAEAGMCAE